MTNQLTPEQKAVINHPRGKHARVLAVAGAGKTTTMVERVKHLVLDMNIGPNHISILMFNRRARFQFQEKLDQILPKEQQPQVHTFHSYSYSLISNAVAKGYIPHVQNVWIGDKEELVRIHVHKAIENLVRRNQIPPDSVDPDEVAECIGLWKGSLIPYERAGHHTNPNIAFVYEEFEKLRLRENAITFDDFVPLAVGMLEGELAMRREHNNRYEVVIVDEYQDINYGQQRLIEIVAGTRADVMVVGDDDQTIYEWRGARPDYMIRQFASVFGGKPSIDYKLSRTFRFGPVLAQCAQNVISFNHIRVEKPLISHKVSKESNVYVLYDTSEQASDIDKELTAQIVALVKQTRDPRQIIVLSRMFSQFTSLEGEFLSQGIPYRVIGRGPFFERREIVVLLDYLRLAFSLQQPMNQDLLKTLLSIANVPNRKLSKDVISRTAKAKAQTGTIVRSVIESLSDPLTSDFTQRQRNAIEDLLSVLERLNEKIHIRTRPICWQHTDLVSGSACLP